MPAAADMRRTKNIHFDFRCEHRVFANQFSFDKNAGKMRIGDYCFLQSITTVFFETGNFIAKTMRKRLDDWIQISLFFVKETITISDQILAISDLRAIDGRIINFSKNAAPDGEPDAARRCVRCSYRFFTSRCPARLDTRGSERCRILPERCHGCTK